MLICSVLIAILYVWPEVENINSLMSKNKDLEDKLALIKSKKTAIRSLNEGLSQSPENEDLLKKYLPEERVEERVVDSINFSAASSSVSLINIYVDRLEKKSSVEDEDTLSLPSSKIAKAVEESYASNEVAVAKVPINLQDTIVVAEISAQYDNIKNFLEKIDRIPIMSTVEGIKVSKVDGVQQGSGSVTNQFLVADIAINFHNLKPIKVNNSYNFEVLNSSSWDFSSLDKITSFVSSQGDYQLEVGEKGNINPFFNL